MSINPQFTFDNHGKPVGVFLSMSDWNCIAPLVSQVNEDVQDWQRELIQSRIADIDKRETDGAVDDAIPAEDFLEELKHLDRVEP